MKAALYERYGPPTVIKISDVPKPSAGPNDVLVRVHASTVNRTDTGLRSAVYIISRLYTGLFRPKNQIQGCEFAGEVEAVGANVSGFASGDLVFGFDDGSNGGHAEYKVADSRRMIAHTPDGFTSTEIVGAGEGAFYALNYIEAAGIKSGDRVLVNGATGAIGSAAVQIICSLGATVVATCREEHKELVLGLGATDVIDYESVDYSTLDHKFDVVFDAVGKSSFGAARKVLIKRGTYMSTELGKGAQNPLLALFTKLLPVRRVRFPIPKLSKRRIDQIAELLAAKKFRPVVDRTYSLDQIIEATEYVETAQKVGVVVIDLAIEKKAPSEG